MATELLYLVDTYRFEANTNVVDVRETERGLAVVLDATIFYPQWGGQPADHGVLTSATGKFIVSDVRLDTETSEVLHFGTFEDGAFEVGQEVHGVIDAERRALHARLHSAGHLLDIAVHRAGLTALVPTKGYHFSDGPYVEYEAAGTPLEAIQVAIPSIEHECDALIAENIFTVVKSLTPEQAQAQGIWAPAGKSARIVGFGTYDPCGCGGTHVASSAAIGQIRIRKISLKNGAVKVAYEI